MPDSEVPNYRTKSFVARDGSQKTWMIEWLRWDGGGIIPKLGSVMIPTDTGIGTTGTTGYAAADFPRSWDDTERLVMAYESTEIGGQRVGTSEKGRLYAFNELVTGEARYGLGYHRTEQLPDNWKAGGTIVDALGKSYTVEYIKLGAAGFTGDNAADEAAHPTLTMQVQGICPYGWHIASAADWLDLAWAACNASVGHTFPMQEDQVTYKQLTTASGTGANNNPVSPRGIGNFGAWLRNSEWTVGSNIAISDGADEFGFNYYPLGWRYMTQGYQYAGSRAQTWVPLSYSATAAFRINVLLGNAVSYVEMLNFDNGQPVVPIRCVKNYK
jgi:uncharacterized protein (TIGR02145 family)